VADLELINNSEREFTDISSEDLRVYLLANGQKLEILHPQWLSVSASGNHYIVNSEGTVYVVAPGWMILSWVPKAGQPHFVA